MQLYHRKFIFPFTFKHWALGHRSQFLPHLLTNLKDERLWESTYRILPGQRRLGRRDWTIHRFREVGNLFLISRRLLHILRNRALVHVFTRNCIVSACPNKYIIFFWSSNNWALFLSRINMIFLGRWRRWWQDLFFSFTIRYSTISFRWLILFIIFVNYSWSLSCNWKLGNSDK